MYTLQLGRMTDDDRGCLKNKSRGRGAQTFLGYACVPGTSEKPLYLSGP